MIVRRPLGSWAREIEESGFVLTANSKSVWYAVFEGDIAVLLTPAVSGGWLLGEVGPRERAVLLSRYPARKLRFPTEPNDELWQRESLPCQRVETKRIKLAYVGQDTKRLLGAMGQLLEGTWDNETSPLDAPPQGASPADLEPQTVLKLGITRKGRYLVIGSLAPLLAAQQAGEAEVEAEVVVRHPGWEKAREAIIAHGGRHRGKLYQKVRHPDLSDLAASHDDDRLPIIRSALNGYDPSGKRLLDIGAHWGQMSRAMEDLGFDVTAVEHSPSGVKKATLLRDATESRYRIWHGSIFDFPDIEQHQVILGLNIFHHFLKRKETYDGLVSILDRSKADIIIFAAHVHDRGPDFIGAYKNYRPDEFAAFVAQTSRLPNVLHIGTSHDGRNLYKLWR